MLSITINNTPTRIGDPLPDTIYSFVTTYSFVPMMVPKEQIPLIKQWFNNLIDRLSCDYVTFNNVLIPTSELNKF